MLQKISKLRPRGSETTFSKGGCKYQNPANGFLYDSCNCSYQNTSICLAALIIECLGVQSALVESLTLIMVVQAQVEASTICYLVQSFMFLSVEG